MDGEKHFPKEIFQHDGPLLLEEGHMLSCTCGMAAPEARYRGRALMVMVDKTVWLARIDSSGPAMKQRAPV